MTKKSEIGKKGEDIACDYLKKQHYRIIDRNFLKSWGEIDIICQDTERTLVFIEIKTMEKYGDADSANSIVPEDQLTKAKFSKLARTASLYAGSNQNLIREDRGWRIDLIAIIIENDKAINIRHYKNIER